ncbi:Hypothetical Protein FCC1311_117102, partial [Hondaea fermentalgiana]
LTGILFIPAFGTHPLFGTLGPVGTQGGHGTAAGVTASYAALGFPEGGDLGITAATFGILFGVIVGTILCNIANYFGWSRMSLLLKQAEDAESGTVDSYSKEQANPMADVDNVPGVPAQHGFEVR